MFGPGHGGGIAALVNDREMHGLKLAAPGFTIFRYTTVTVTMTGKMAAKVAILDRLLAVTLVNRVFFCTTLGIMHLHKQQQKMLYL